MKTETSPGDRLFEFQQNLLVKEIEYIHSRIAHYDDLSFKIKGWAVTIWSGIVAFGAREDAPLVVSTSIPAIAAFWILDAYFKQYQRRSMNRMAVIEMFLDSRGYFEESGVRAAFEKKNFGQFPIHDPISSRTKKLNENFNKRYRERTNYWKSFTVSNVFYFYLILLLGAVVVALLLINT
jgi:hypothetical protein